MLWLIITVVTIASLTLIPLFTLWQRIFLNIIMEYILNRTENKIESHILSRTIRINKFNTGRRKINQNIETLQTAVVCWCVLWWKESTMNALGGLSVNEIMYPLPWAISRNLADCISTHRHTNVSYIIRVSALILLAAWRTNKESF